MASITLKNVVKKYHQGKQSLQVIHGVNADIAHGEFVVIVGPSGCGKSTLLRLISGDYELREGTFSKPSDLRIGFLNQDLLSMDIGDCVRDVVLSGRDDLVQLENEINRLIEKIEVEYVVIDASQVHDYEQLSEFHHNRLRNQIQYFDHP